MIKHYFENIAFQRFVLEKVCFVTAASSQNTSTVRTGSLKLRLTTVVTMLQLVQQRVVHQQQCQHMGMHQVAAEAR